MIIGFSHYNLRASRPLLDELCSFYCDIVGLKRGQRPSFTSFGYWLYAGEQDVLHLTETRSDEVRQINVATTFDHVAFNCIDRATVESRLNSYGIDYQVAAVPMSQRVQLFFKDPAGNGVELNFDC